MHLCFPLPIETASPVGHMHHILDKDVELTAYSYGLCRRVRGGFSV